jgi:hypothetical protein
MKVLQIRAGRNNMGMLVGNRALVLYEARGGGGWYQGSDTGQTATPVKLPLWLARWGAVTEKVVGNVIRSGKDYGRSAWSCSTGLVADSAKAMVGLRPSFSAVDYLLPCYDTNSFGTRSWSSLTLIP